MEQSRAGLLLCPSSLITESYASSLDPTHHRRVLRVVDDRRLAVVSAMFAWYPSPSSQPLSVVSTSSPSTSSPLSRPSQCAPDFLAVLSTSSLSSRSPRPGLRVLPVISTSSPWSRDPCRRLDLLTLVSMPSLSSQHPRRRLNTLTLLSASSFPPSSPDHRGGHAPPSQSLSSRWSGRVQSGFVWVYTSTVGLIRLRRLDTLVVVCFDLPFLRSSRRCCV